MARKPRKEMSGSSKKGGGRSEHAFEAFRPKSVVDVKECKTTLKDLCVSEWYERKRSKKLLTLLTFLLDCRDNMRLLRSQPLADHERRSLFNVPVLICNLFRRIPFVEDLNAHRTTANMATVYDGFAWSDEENTAEPRSVRVVCSTDGVSFFDLER